MCLSLTSDCESKNYCDFFFLKLTMESSLARLGYPFDG